jgi:hypothetical protein
MENNVFLGGKVIVLEGDFRQVLPVVLYAWLQTANYSKLYKIFSGNILKFLNYLEICE